MPGNFGGPGFEFISAFTLEINTTGQFISTIAGQTVNLPAGPFARVSGSGDLKILNALTLQGSFWFPRETPARLLRLIAGGALDLSPLQAEVFPPTEINEALERSLAVSGGLRHVCLDCRTPSAA